jgi:hypothetical protein
VKQTISFVSFVSQNFFQSDHIVSMFYVSLTQYSMQNDSFSGTVLFDETVSSIAPRPSPSIALCESGTFLRAAP